MHSTSPFFPRGDVGLSVVVIIVNPATVNSGGCYCTVRRSVDLVAWIIIAIVAIIHVAITKLKLSLFRAWNLWTLTRSTTQV